LKETGFEVGPDLASLSDKSPESLLVALLDPNRAVETKYLNYAAVTKGGLSFNGMLATETGNSITLRGPAGKEQTILRADLDELVSTSKSTMPEGLEKDLRPADVADIIAHVRANVPLPQRKEFEGNSPALITAAADGSFLLTASACEIYGTTLVLEKQYGNLGWWSSLDDQAAWTVDVKRAGKFAVEFDYACDQSVAEINLWRFDAGPISISGKVVSTGGWDKYVQSRFGEIELAAGKQRVVLRPAKRIQGALLDLRNVRLVPLP
jgi:putative heme-binding domain-containing protein